jgi:GNAT superfamily N-acetyltransferase
MITIDRYRAEDRASVESMFRRLHGDAGAAAFLKRWRWQYEQNPSLPNAVPLIWLARIDGEVVGQYATMPVKLMVNGTEIDAAWGMDVMIMPEHQRLGIGRLMFEAWDQGVGASIGLGLTDASYGLFKKLHWPDLGRVPRFLKKLSARVQDNPPTAGRKHERVIRTVRNALVRLSPVSANVKRVRSFDEGVTQLWEREGTCFAFAVRRDAAYLNWKFLDATHLKYEAAVVERNGETNGYLVLHHAQQNGWRATIISDFFCAPADTATFSALLHWAEHEALAAKADVLRVFATHAGFGEMLRRNGYVNFDPAMRMVAKINAVTVPPNYYDTFANWHVTIGDSDNDR